MAVRSHIAFSVVIAGQVLAGCGMPGKGEVARDDRSQGRKAELAVRDAQLRRQVEKGTFGLAQLFPGGKSVDARHVPPLPRPSTIAPVASLGVRARQSSESAMPMQPMQLAAAAGNRDTCVYKPVMSDADMDACR
jgi:hypothetical protein